MNNIIKIIIVVMAIGLMGCGNMSGTGYISPNNITDGNTVDLPGNSNIDDGSGDDGTIDPGDDPVIPYTPSVENPDKTGKAPCVAPCDGSTQEGGLYQVDKVRITEGGGSKIYFTEGGGS